MEPENALRDCHFLPISSLEKTIDFINSRGRHRFERGFNLCRKNLLELQRKRNMPPSLNKGSFNWGLHYNIAVKKAIEAHDWNKLHILLSKCPIWKQPAGQSFYDVDHYMRALVILLMYHPRAKAQSLLHQFMHMVLGCRSDEDKLAFTKLLVALPSKYVTRTNKYSKQNEDDV